MTRIRLRSTLFMVDASPIEGVTVLSKHHKRHIAVLRRFSNPIVVVADFLAATSMSRQSALEPFHTLLNPLKSRSQSSSTPAKEKIAPCILL